MSTEDILDYGGGCLRRHEACTFEIVLFARVTLGTFESNGLERYRVRISKLPLATTGRFNISGDRNIISQTTNTGM